MLQMQMQMLHVCSILFLHAMQCMVSLHHISFLISLVVMSHRIVNLPNVITRVKFSCYIYYILYTYTVLYTIYYLYYRIIDGFNNRTLYRCGQDGPRMHIHNSMHTYWTIPSYTQSQYTMYCETRYYPPCN